MSLSTLVLIAGEAETWATRQVCVRCGWRYEPLFPQSHQIRVLLAVPLKRGHKSAPVHRPQRSRHAGRFHAAGAQEVGHQGVLVGAAPHPGPHGGGGQRASACDAGCGAQTVTRQQSSVREAGDERPHQQKRRCGSGASSLRIGFVRWHAASRAPSAAASTPL